MKWQIAVAVWLSTFTTSAFAATNFVSIYSDTLGQLVTSSTLVWQSYIGDPKQLEYAVHAAKYMSEDENYQMYVCRALVEGIMTSGHTQKHQNRVVCVISMHMEVQTHSTFDILLNKGHGAKLAWKPWSKFSAGIPRGAVSAVSAGHVEDVYVARHKAHIEHTQPDHHHHHTGVDYNVGRFAPKQSLGKVIVSEDQNEREYDDGQILVESEPIRYELRNIKLDKWRTQINRNSTLLGSKTLSNLEDMPSVIETVISYQYDIVYYWGNLEGVARGLSTKIFETDKAVEIMWGLKETIKKIETKPVSATLQPGTALNVTLSGNYTKIEAPYRANLVSFYANSSDSVTRNIEAIVQKADMMDVKIEFSPVYWLHNFTLVPTTTTTTTTTTTSTTTPPTTTKNKEPQPALPPPIVNDEFIGNDIAADESRESAIEDKYKMIDVNDKKENGSARIYGTMIVITPFLLLLLFRNCI